MFTLPDTEAVSGQIACLNLTKRFVELENGATFPIVNVFDSRGLETVDYEEAVLCIAECSDGPIYVRIAHYDTRKLH